MKRIKGTVISGDMEYTTIPKAVSYTDSATVLAVQKALVAAGYKLKPTKNAPDGCDGVFGADTSRAIKAMQKDLGAPQTGVVDYGVLMTLKVQAPPYTPTTTTARSVSAAKKAEDDADKATTPAEVAAAAKGVEAANAVAIPPPPPATQEKVAKAVIAAKAAKTPAEVEAAKEQLKDAAASVAASQSFLGAPLYVGAPVNRWQAGLIGLGLGAVIYGVYEIVSSKTSKRKK